MEILSWIFLSFSLRFIGERYMQNKALHTILTLSALLGGFPLKLFSLRFPYREF